MTKGRAFAIHLTASAAVVLILFAIMRLLWYPAPYFDINGGWTVLRILAGVDVVLGPILTLIVFKPGKPSLKFDMSVIVALQRNGAGFELISSYASGSSLSLT